MTKSKLVREIRIYLYADGNHEVRVIDHTVVKPAKPKSIREVTPATVVTCPKCGERFRVHRRQAGEQDELI